MVTVTWGYGVKDGGATGRDGSTRGGNIHLFHLIWQQRVRDGVGVIRRQVAIEPTYRGIDTLVKFQAISVHHLRLRPSLFLDTDVDVRHGLYHQVRTAPRLSQLLLGSWWVEMPHPVTNPEAREAGVGVIITPLTLSTRLHVPPGQFT